MLQGSCREGHRRLEEHQNCNVDETIQCYETQAHIFVRIMCPFDKLFASKNDGFVSKDDWK